MPFIKIKSLEFEETVDIAETIVKISRAFSEKAGIDIEHITATWEYLAPDHYAVAGVTATAQPLHTHPVLVDLLIPDFNGPGTIKTMIEAVAASISKNTPVPFDNIFVNCILAHSGMVFDAGQIEEW